MTRSKQTVAAFIKSRINAVHHRLICGKYSSRIGVLFPFCQITKRKIRQLIMKRPLCLDD